MDIKNFNDFINGYQNIDNFVYCKINHVFWEKLALLEKNNIEFKSKSDLLEADRLWKVPGFFSSGMALDLLSLLEKELDEDNLNFHIGLETNAFSGDDIVTNSPKDPQAVESVLRKFKLKNKKVVSGLILKDATVSGEIIDFYSSLNAKNLLIVIPKHLDSIRKIKNLNGSCAIHIPGKNNVSQTLFNLTNIQNLIGSWINSFKKSEKLTILFQAGPIAVYLILKLYKKFDNVKWVDMGTALSISSPEEIFNTPWGCYNRKKLVNTYNLLFGDQAPVQSEISRLDFIDDFIGKVSKRRNSKTKPKVLFIENKEIIQSNINSFLSLSESSHQWANYGPVVELLQKSYKRYFRNIKNKDVIACANGGFALSVIISIIELKRKSKLRWIASAFSYLNLGRGRTYDLKFIDCDNKGLLDFDGLEKEKNNFDAIILTNIFGIKNNLDKYYEWSIKNNKEIVIDNAAGINENLPDYPYQSLSLHHTKPFGYGEGGLMVLPEDDTDIALSLMEYRKTNNDLILKNWIGNGKLSDISAAYHLSRLSSVENWYMLYKAQSIRILNIASQLNLKPLVLGPNISMSYPFLTKKNISIEDLDNPLIQLGKYYPPLAEFPNALRIYRSIINIPCHPGMLNLSNDDIKNVLSKII